MGVVGGRQTSADVEELANTRFTGQIPPAVPGDPSGLP
jgi:hypothetical protein